MDWLKWNPECRHLNSNGAFAYGTHLVLTTFFICAKPNSLSAALIKNAPVFIAAILAVSMWNGPEAHETKYNWKIFQHFLRNMKTDYAALFSRVFQFLMKWSSTCALCSLKCSYITLHLHLQPDQEKLSWSSGQLLVTCQIYQPIAKTDQLESWIKHFGFWCAVSTTGVVLSILTPCQLQTGLFYAIFYLT